MKKKIVLLFLLSCFFSFSQNKNIVIPWKKNVSNTDKENIFPFSIAQFKNQNVYSFSKQWKTLNYVDPTSLLVSNIIFEPLLPSEVKELDVKKIPTIPSYKISTGNARGVLYTMVSISPVVNNNGRYSKIRSFSISYLNKTTKTVNSKSLAITNSVLATGDWYKFQVDKTGVYQITKSFLNSLGMNVNEIDPRNIKVYGNGGAMLPLLNEENTQFDLRENAIQVVGEEDGSFDSGDFILFYGEGTQQYNEESDTNINAYDDISYYYITVSGGIGKRINPLIEPDGAPVTIITQFHDYQFFEEDDFSPVKVGRRWFGNRFDIETEQSFEFEFPNIVAGQPMNVKVLTAASSESATQMDISINGQNVSTHSYTAIGDVTLAQGRTFSGTVPASSEIITVDLTYNNNGNPASVAYLDYISIEALRLLQGVEGQLVFKNNDVATLSGIGQYTIGNASQFTQVWDVTNPEDITNINNAGEATFSFKANFGELRNYIAVNPNDYFTPIRGAQTTVSNQNLKGTIFLDESGSFQDIDYLIITAPFMIQPALKLAEHHKNNNNLNVKVITTDKIYEEFSSGKQDIVAIRNFVKYVYDNASVDSRKLKYLCLFGDTSVDYKDRLAGNNNIVPTFHNMNSFNTLLGFMSDDFFGNMDANEGRMFSTERLDIAVGRIIADEVNLANILIDKLIDYDSKASYGNWRNNFTLLSDDVDAIFEFSELEGSLDALGDQIGRSKPFINVYKIHSDAFQQESSAGGNRYPEVNEAIANAIDVGTLVLTYLGHGGEDGLAKEFIYTKTNANDLKNKNKYPLIVTVTCEFTRFDNPLRPTAGEFTYWNNTGGAIGLITTTRTIGVSLGVRFNQGLARHLFSFDDDIFDTPAEALRKAKNEEGDNIRRVIFFVGDPAMQLAFPKQQIRLSTLNGVPIREATDTLQALSRVILGGEVLSESGVLLSDYNGIAEIKVFDKRVQRQTLGNDGVRDAVTNELLILDFETLGAGIFNGQATVTNGKFEVEFVVPRDIAIPVGNGRVSFYSQRTVAFEDQTGFNEQIKVGGLDENAPEDNQGPLIQLFMNDESFVSGGITNDSPILIVKLEDEHGINTAGGIGHDMTAIIDGDEANPIILNDYYQANVDDFTKGVTNFRLKNIEEGLHTLTLKAWDVYNNSSTSEIQFLVTGDNELRIERVLNYPNPFVNYTEFWFNHNRPFEPLDVQVQVFTITGKIVWTQNQIITTDGFLSRDIIWDGKDDFGDRIGKGVYIYKITVKSTLTNQKVEKFEKLVIL